jgi:hypothetical protein
MDRLDPATEQYLRKALRAAHAKGVRAGRAEVMASMFAGLNGDGERVLTKALRGVLTKAFDESEHPRDDHGRFVKGEDIEAAKSDPAKAQELRGRVTDPEQRAKLEKQLGGTEAAPTAPKEGAETESPKKGKTEPADSPAWQEFSVSESPLVADREDQFLKSYLAETGRDKPPKVATTAEVDAMAADGHRVLYRGLTDPAQAEQFRSGSMFQGVGAMGNGTYSAYDPDGGDAAAEIARGYAGEDGEVFRVVLPKDAKVVNADDLRREQADALEAAGSDRERAILRDMGRFAALRGYDAIDSPGLGYVVLLNRPILTVEKPAARKQKNTGAQTRPPAAPPPDVEDGRRRVRDGLTPEQVAEHVEAADLDPTQFTPDDLFQLSKQAPAETGARRRMLAELANHESSVSAKLEKGGTVHPEVMAHHPHLSKPAGSALDHTAVADAVRAGVASGAVASGIDLKTAAEKSAGRSLSREELDRVATGLGKADWSTLLNQTSGKQFKDWQRDVARQAKPAESGTTGQGPAASGSAPPEPAAPTPAPAAGEPAKKRTGRKPVQSPQNPPTVVDKTAPVGDTSSVGSAGPAPGQTGGGAMTTSEPHVVQGDTYRHKDAIRAAGGRWDGERKHWTVPASVAASLPAGLTAVPHSQTEGGRRERLAALAGSDGRRTSEVELGTFAAYVSKTYRPRGDDRADYMSAAGVSAAGRRAGLPFAVVLDEMAGAGYPTTHLAGLAREWDRVLADGLDEDATPESSSRDRREIADWLARNGGQS